MSVARALYAGGEGVTTGSSANKSETIASNIELYVFDDALASVDVHVGKSLFRDALCALERQGSSPSVAITNF